MGSIDAPSASCLLAGYHRMQNKHYYGRDQRRMIRLEERTMYLISSRFALQTQNRMTQRAGIDHWPQPPISTTVIALEEVCLLIICMVYHLSK